MKDQPEQVSMDLVVVQDTNTAETENSYRSKRAKEYNVPSTSMQDAIFTNQLSIDETLITPKGTEKSDPLYVSIDLQGISEIVDKRLTAFDRSVFNSTMSLFMAGNEIITDQMILRVLTASSNTRFRYVSEDDENSKDGKPHSIENLIKDSLAKMMSTQITYKIPIKGGRDKVLYENLLTARMVTDAKINGMSTDTSLTIKIYSIPYLYFCACEKGDIYRFPVDVRDVGISHTESSISLLDYLLQQIIYIYEKKQEPILPIDEIYRIENTGKPDPSKPYSKTKKIRCRKKVKDILDHFVDKGLITSWEWKKSGRIFSGVGIQIAKSLGDYSSIVALPKITSPEEDSESQN